MTKMSNKEMMDVVRNVYPSARLEHCPTGWLVMLNESSFAGIMMCGSTKRGCIENAYTYVKKNL